MKQITELSQLSKGMYLQVVHGKTIHYGQVTAVIPTDSPAITRVEILTYPIFDDCQNIGASLTKGDTEGEFESVKDKSWGALKFFKTTKAAIAKVALHHKDVLLKEINATATTQRREVRKKFKTMAL